MTRTFLLTWNPKKWPWNDLASAVDQVATAGIFFEPWSVGNRMDLPPGSRVFLMRLGEPPRGLVGSGWSTTPPRRIPHWDPQKKADGVETPSIGVEFDFLQEAPVLSADDLAEPPFDSMYSWTPQSSGIEIPSTVAEALGAMWAMRTARIAASPLPDAVGTSTFPEGAVRRITVNAYERDPRARRLCIAYYGTSCHVCEFAFAQAYGEEFSGFIHVHHLRPLSSLGGTYELDPVEDLRPVCPNCHAALHHRREPYSIEELRAIMAIARESA